MHFVTFGSSGSDCEKERVLRTCVRGQGSCFQGKRYQRDLRFFTVYAYNDLLAVRAAHPPVTVGWPSWHLQLLNPSDWNDLPCPVLASCSWPVSLLMVKCVQAMRERSGHLECRSFVLADSQGAVASPASAVLRAFAPNANILLKMQ